MEIEANKDFKRGRAEVLAVFRDPARLESVMAGMGADMVRTAEPPAPRWEGAVTWRNEPRRFVLTSAEPAQDETIRLDFVASIADAVFTFDFYDLPDGGCRVIAKGTISAHSMLTKLALQSLRLVKGKAEARVRRFVTNMGKR